MSGRQTDRHPIKTLSRQFLIGTAKVVRKKLLTSIFSSFYAFLAYFWRFFKMSSQVFESKKCLAFSISYSHFSVITELYIILQKINVRYHQPSIMKIAKRLSLLLACLILSLSTFNSCDLDTSPEPDHPLYVTYTISASSLEFTGPEKLLLDFQAWVKENQVVYDKQVSYKTGDASEFSKTDAEAVKKFEEFQPLFKTYLNELKKKLENGVYGNPPSNVAAMFCIYASRTQGEGGNLKYEQIKFSYP